ncbi:MAG: ABC transporter ATP-binding protein, partial [Bacteroidota bacterium]
IAVSHDRYFLNRVCNGILAFEGDGKVHFSEGNYDYYIEKRDARFAADIEIEKQKKLETSAKPEPKKLKWKEAKELETIEQDILKAEEEVHRIEAIFATDDFYQKHGDKVESLTKELDAGKEKVERLYARWTELEKLKNG